METDPDNTSVVKDQDRVRFFGKSSLFVFARQAFGEKGHIYDLSPSMRVRGMEFWDLPNVFPVFIRVLFFWTSNLLGFLVADSFARTPGSTFRVP